MIPYVTVSGFSLFGFAVHPFGLLAFAGVIAGYAAAVREARRRGIPDGRIDPVIVISVAVGIVGSALGDALFYRPGEFLADPLAAFDFRTHMSSTSGLLFGTAAGIAAVTAFKLPLIKSAASFFYGFAHGWLFARLGCALVHDHPGTLSDFPLAVRFPLGARHDLGLYEFLFTLVLVLILQKQARRLSDGALLSLIAVSYCLFRFPMDYLRVGDARYFGHTPAQYFCLAVLAGFAFVFVRRRQAAA